MQILGEPQISSPLRVTTLRLWKPDLKIISGLIYFYGLLKLFSHLISIMEVRVVQSPYSGEIFENFCIFQGNLLLNVINLEAFLQYWALLEAVIKRGIFPLMINQLCKFNWIKYKR